MLYTSQSARASKLTPLRFTAMCEGNERPLPDLLGGKSRISALFQEGADVSSKLTGVF